MLLGSANGCGICGTVDHFAGDANALRDIQSPKHDQQNTRFRTAQYDGLFMPVSDFGDNLSAECDEACHQ
ncbi:unnamed protein product [Phytophthora fragariaefolia]|uniref:Unnamed protein product n=1 Tax=Phytophthora fragariaefolia TaxID=1490495 RepID=A0A9W7CK32_9STRA|nr:unnamed protein product [Phytophthora fragariaefolia]